MLSRSSVWRRCRRSACRGRVLDVGVEIVGAGLPDRVRRVADDDVDGGVELADDAVVVLREHDRVHAVAGFGDLEGVGEGDPGERFVVVVGRGLAGQGVVGGFDVDRGDVVGEQHDFVGVQLVAVLAGQVVGGDEPGLHERGEECSGAGESVEDVHVLVGESAAEVYRLPCRLLGQLCTDRSIRRSSSYPMPN